MDNNSEIAEHMLNDQGSIEKKHFATINPSRMCQPMGAIIALLGVKGAMPIIHGSQGCSTYMRFQLCRHYREPINVASTSMNEGTVVYGGEKNLIQALDITLNEHDPSLVGITSSCLTETIGDDILGIISKFKDSNMDFNEKPIVPISTPSYNGSHVEGYDNAVLSLVESLTSSDNPSKLEINEYKKINIVPGIISPADIIEVKNILHDLKANFTIITDISESLNSPLTGEVSFLPLNGTTVEEICDSKNSSATFSLSRHANSAGRFLEKKYGVKSISGNLPVGIKNTDRFIYSISELTGNEIPENIENDRGRLIDAIIDANSYNYNRKFAIFGDPDFVSGLTRFLSELGMIPSVLCSGTYSKRFKEDINEISNEKGNSPVILCGGDLYDLHEEIKKTSTDILIGNSYGLKIANEENIPLFRLGFPIFDRLGAQRTSIIGYKGGLRIVDSITNIILERYYDDHGYALKNE